MIPLIYALLKQFEHKKIGSVLETSRTPLLTVKTPCFLNFHVNVEIR